MASDAGTSRPSAMAEVVAIPARRSERRVAASGIEVGEVSRIMVLSKDGQFRGRFGCSASCRSPRQKAH